jgi:branched-chain amino acid aminotransferase
VAEPTFADREGWIWMDGTMVPWRDAKVHVLTHTLHYGLGVFEGVRAYATPQGPCVFRLEDHTERLFDSAHIVGLTLPFTRDEINAAQCEVFKANELDEGYLRPMAYLGSEAMGLRAQGLSVHVSIAAWPWPDYMDADSREKGIKVRTSSYTRHHVNSTMCKAKSNGNYTNSILALHEALDSGCDEALLLDNEGYVSEGSGENVFIYEVVERRITRDEVYIADEAFFTGTAAEVLPIRSLDGRQIGDGKRGPITQELQQNYFDQVRGKRTAFPAWHTPVQ